MHCEYRENMLPSRIELVSLFYNEAKYGFIWNKEDKGTSSRTKLRCSTMVYREIDKIWVAKTDKECQTDIPVEGSERGHRIRAEWTVRQTKLEAEKFTERF